MLISAWFLVAAAEVLDMSRLHSSVGPDKPPGIRCRYLSTEIRTPGPLVCLVGWVGLVGSGLLGLGSFGLSGSGSFGLGSPGSG